MKILYRILVILLGIPIILCFTFGMPISLIISPIIYLFTGRTKGFFLDMNFKTVDYLLDVIEKLAEKGE